MSALRRLVPIVALAACSANGHRPDAAGTPPGTAPAPAAPEATPPPPEAGAIELTEDMARPHFADGAAAAAAARFALEDWAAARKGFAALARGEKDLARRTRLELMVALCDARLERHGDAATRLERLATRLPLLADWLRYQAAASYYHARAPGKARALAAAVAPGSIAGADAELLVGDLLRGAGDARAVAAHYRAYLADRPRGIRLAEARFHRARALEALGGSSRAEAAALYRQIVVKAPVTGWSEQAAARLAALRAQRAPGVPPERLDAAELIERGMIHFDGMRNKDSEADFAAALTAPGLDGAGRCVAAYHRAQSVFKQRDRTRAAPLFDEAIPACEQAANTDLAVKAAYQAGRSYSNIGQHELAIPRYQRAEKSAGGVHSYGDDARLRLAEEHLELGHHDRVTELLSSLPTTYPTGDMRAEALWRLAWRSYKDGKLDDAVGWLTRQIQTVPVDDNYWAEGQAQYWLGRCHDRLGRPEQAATAYAEAVTRYPMSYYALLALNRLRERHPARLQTLRAEISAPPPGWDASQPAFRFRPRALYATDDFARALEFLRLGLGAEAEAELRRLGLTPPSGKERVTDPDQQDRLWAMAFLYHGAGRFGPSHWVTRWHILDYKRAWPVGGNRARWEIAYPRAWWPLLDANARKHGYPTELLISFVREESAFDPLRESFANAIGLTQMIMPTAERFARGTGIRVDRAALRDPDKNVTIGARFLGFLVARFGGRVALVVPSYNAGEGATGKWLAARGSWPLDEFAEEIPYDETRNYSKRVLASYFAYSYLKDGTIPEMPNDIPPKD